MSGTTLPIVPTPQPDESLSSWVERIGLFYGGDYERALGLIYARAGRLPLLQTHDIDTDVHARESVCAWTGTPEFKVPAVLNLTADTLPPRARLTYCPACWDEDVNAGRPPYLRRWAGGSVIHCETHRCWLTAKRPARRSECQHLGWVALWRSRLHWALPFELSFQQSIAQMLVEFDSSAVQLSSIDWDSLNSDLKQFEHAADPCCMDRKDLAVHRAILQIVRDGPLHSLRYKIAERMMPHHRCGDIVDHVRSRVPLWHGTRVVVLLIAVESLRLTQGRSPVDADVSGMIRACKKLRQPLYAASMLSTQRDGTERS